MTYNVNNDENEIGECEMCKKESQLIPTRYSDEGLFGDHHLICQKCRSMLMKRDQEDLEAMYELDDDLT